MADEVDRFLEGYPPDIRDLTHQIRALIASITPDADENLKLGWKVIWYGFGEAKGAFGEAKIPGEG